MSLRRHTTLTDLSHPTIADDQSDSAGDDNSMPQLNIPPIAQQLDLPTSPNLLIISSAVRDAMDQVMATYVNEVEIWKIISKVDKKEQAMVLVYELKKEDPSGIRDKILNEYNS